MNLPRLFSLALFATVTLAARADVAEMLNRTYPLPRDGIVRLNNINGSIIITAWDRDEVSIEAEKRGRDEDDLKRISIEIDAQPASLVIKTTIAKSLTNLFNRSSRAQVIYRLHVPTHVRLERIVSVNSSIQVDGMQGAMSLDAVNGSVHATGLAGDVEIESVNGSVTANFSSLAGVRSIDLESVNGRIDLTLPKDASGRIEARTTNGRTSIEQPIKLGDSSRRRLSGEIGSGHGPTIKAATTNGGVTIHEG